MASTESGFIFSMTPIILGAAGAFLGFYIKESVQKAIERRIIANQLEGYLISLKTSFLRIPNFFPVYKKVKSRRQELAKAQSLGLEEFGKTLNLHKEEIGKFITDLEKKISDPLDDGSFFNLNGPASETLLSLFQVILDEQKAAFLDSKLFISDRDAAVLGRSVALHTVRFRASIITLAESSGVILKMAKLNDVQANKFILGQLEPFLTTGEDALGAFIELELAVERLRNRSLLKLSLDVFQGH